MDVRTPLFPSPYDVATPKGAEGWEGMYPYYVRFCPERREADDQVFWFRNVQHWPKPVRPFDMILVEYAAKTLGQYNTRHLRLPAANGINYRVLNGYVYFAPISVPDAEIEPRIADFVERASYYYENWAELLEPWHHKVKDAVAQLEALQFEDLPPVVPMDWVKDAKGIDPTTPLLAAYDEALQLCHRIWQYHFEFLNLGYAAYLDFFEFLKAQFPSIPDQAIARMIQGDQSILFRPDEELRTLARFAIELDVATALKAGSVAETLEAVAALPHGDTWLTAWEEAKRQWFHFTSGNGFCSTDRYWIDHLEIPLSYVRNYLTKIEAGEDIARDPATQRAERDRITAEYSALLPPELNAVFREKLDLARKVYPFVEDHNFYIEHWAMSVFWRKMRDLSGVFVRAGFWDDIDDLFFLDRNQLREALWDLAQSWAIGTAPAGPEHWPRQIAHRRAILDRLSETVPLFALNSPTETANEPFTLMLFGLTQDSIAKAYAAPANQMVLKGMAGSPGVVEGRARVLQSPDQLAEIEQGDILVAPITAPGWAPVFGTISAVVTDVGGMMSHAAILCREYGVPAVTGTGVASSKLETGMWIRVDGVEGVVTILECVRNTELTS